MQRSYEIQRRQYSAPAFEGGDWAFTIINMASAG